MVKCIENFLAKYTDAIQIYDTNNPDIVFEFKKIKVAIEVETGKKYDKDFKYIEEKVARLNKIYRNNWFFVVLDWNYKEKYSRFGKTYVRKEVPMILEKSYFTPGS